MADPATFLENLFSSENGLFIQLHIFFSFYCYLITIVNITNLSSEFPLQNYIVPFYYLWTFSNEKDEKDHVYLIDSSTMALRSSQLLFQSSLLH